jgi:hypothetical protein
MKTKEMQSDWELEWSGYHFKFIDMTYAEVCDEMEGLVDLTHCCVVRTKPLKALQPLSEPLVEPLKALRKEV